MSEKLASISEFGEQSTATSITGLSDYTGYSPYTRSPSVDSFNTISSAATSRYCYGLPGNKKIATDNALQQRIRNKSLAQKKNYELCKKIRVSTALVGILLLVAAIFMLSFYLPKQYENSEIIIEKKEKKQHTTFADTMIFHHDNPLQLNFSTNFTTGDIQPSNMKPKLKAYLGQLLTKAARQNYSKTVLNHSLTMVFQELDYHTTTLRIKKQNFSEKCFQIYWETHYLSKLEDCFDVNSTHWFGLGEMFDQKWPIDKWSFKMTPFLTSDFLDSYQPNVFGGILEPLVVNSKGAGIYIDENVPLHVSMNENANGKFCIRADNNHYNIKYESENATNFLNYTICIGKNVREVHKILYDQYIKKPNGVPEKRMFEEPIWSTWAQFKKDINQSVIIDFAQKIKDYKFGASHIEIDDKYQVTYGDYNFDPAKFDDPPLMLNILRSLGFRVTVWVFPFANLDSKIFIPGMPHWMEVAEKEVPGIARWWNGKAVILDTTDKSSREWFIKRLKEFQKLNIEGFKFDAGEVNYLPLNFKFGTKQPNPNYYTKHYVEIAAAFSGLSEVRVGYKSQEFPVFVRMLDRSSVWFTKNGLQSVLTATLTFGLLGYPFILPDMVGGNAYLRKPNKELYVRWAQLCAFLPAIQFSIPPWDYDDEVVHIVRQALEIRKNMSDLIYKSANDSITTGEPIVRPLWWYWPDDHETFVIDNEFMLGDEYLIAPVLHLNTVSHAIYLPAGLWKEQWGNHDVVNMTSGGFLQYNVTLSNVCYFKLLNTSIKMNHSNNTMP